ncbi:MAG: urate oxidase [Chloroflexi bacterium]|nr:urate oxidase [Chloroflexota bacterium]
MSTTDQQPDGTRPGVIEMIRYGKADVSVYRTYARPLEGLTPIPESAFVGRPNVLFAYAIDVEIYDDNFAPAYTVGDNRLVVATDTMKNFIQRMALEYDGATLEGFLRFLGRRFFQTWEQMGHLRLSGRELPYQPVAVPAEADRGRFEPSRALFSHARGDHAVAMLEVERDGDDARIVGHRCGQDGLQLIKVTGSAFADFVRDQYTTLPAVRDRPLYIYLDVGWRYANPSDAVSPDCRRYVAAEQIRDLTATVFHQFVSMSIQHLMHEMGQRILARFPQLAEVSFEGQNRLWDTAATSETDEHVKVYTDPRPPYGSLHLTLRRG